MLKNEHKDLASGKYFIDPNLLAPKDRQALESALEKLFGTPAHPIVGELEDSDRELLKLSKETLAEGSKLYRQNCLHCHGKAGDGRGPTARWVNPHPRDYRQGAFKFESVDQTRISRPPHRDDLLRTLTMGIEGTAMPTFALLPLNQREALASYVIHLSLRGRAEYRFFTEGCTFDAGKKTLTYEDPSGNDRPIAEYIAELHSSNVGLWVGSQSAKIKVEPYPYARRKPRRGGSS